MLADDIAVGSLTFTNISNMWERTQECEFLKLSAEPEATWPTCQSTTTSCLQNKFRGNSQEIVIRP